MIIFWQELLRSRFQHAKNMATPTLFTSKSSITVILKPTCLPFDEWVRDLDCTHTHKIYLQTCYGWSSPSLIWGISWILWGCAHHRLVVTLVSIVLIPQHVVFVRIECVWWSQSSYTLSWWHHQRYLAILPRSICATLSHFPRCSSKHTSCISLLLSMWKWTGVWSAFPIRDGRKFLHRCSWLKNSETPPLRPRMPRVWGLKVLGDASGRWRSLPWFMPCVGGASFPNAMHGAPTTVGQSDRKQRLFF